ncbi:hypothetical protein [Capnocytophaga sp.]|uniref:hypothetical protein n=1 Tax=Capnocytophaga sp. TaxID=44737 RepID=UPI0026DB67B3|nr:hypothetical protein [Capnocytophaga sp.]MDO5105794.1 hypothetical protein [Capnocytophaga sp.]
MKKIFLFISTVLLSISCSKNKQICHVPPPVLSLLINKESETYKEFINSAGNLNENTVKMYKEVNTIKKNYPLALDNTYKKGYLRIFIPLDSKNDIYTGKTETLYLQNSAKTYKIEVNGYMQNKGCGFVAYTNEIRVDGIKIEENYLAK